MESIQENMDGQAKILIENGRMTAYLEIGAPSGNGKPCTKEDIKKALGECNVVFGIDEEKINDALLEQNWGKSLVIARGTPPQNGSDAKIIYKFPLTMERMAPKVDEKGNVDYHNLGLIHNVKFGTELVERIPPTEGAPGMDVTGQEIPAKKGKDLRLPKGKNTVGDQNDTRLYSSIDGNVRIKDDKVVVDSIFQLNSDVDFASGNIDFIGNVLINGNVSSGFKVSAGGDIEVQGFIEGATVTAGGNIMVKGGITGVLKGLIKAGENISARFVENSRLEAGKDILVREAIMQSFVKAGGCIKVTDKKAAIVGGIIQASREVESKVIGSQLATQTTIEVGINPHYREEYQQLYKTRSEKTKLMDNYNHNLQVYQRQSTSFDNINENKRKALVKLLDEFKKLRVELAEIEERMAFLENKFQEINTARVKASEIVYPGVRISIGQSMYIVNDAIKYSQFVLDEGEVRLASLR
ncbi:MAG: FapA family protein [Syntrophomonas sp.]